MVWVTIELVSCTGETQIDSNNRATGGSNHKAMWNTVTLHRKLCSCPWPLKHCWGKNPVDKAAVVKAPKYHYTGWQARPGGRKAAA